MPVGVHRQRDARMPHDRLLSVRNRDRGRSTFEAPRVNSDVAIADRRRNPWNDCETPSNQRFNPLPKTKRRDDSALGIRKSENDA
jgi:hypothetical protein